MDIELPNGTILRDVPEGTSKMDIVAKLQAKGHDTSWFKPEPAGRPSVEEGAAPPPSAANAMGETFDPYQDQPLGRNEGAMPSASSGPPPTPAPTPSWMTDANNASTMPTTGGVTPEQSGNAMSVMGDMAVNAIPSTIALGKSLVDAALHPIDTAGSMADLAAGATRAGAKAILPEGVFKFLDSIDNPETTQRITDTAQQVGGHFAQRYGTREGIEQALRTDPAGVASDLSMLLTGGGGLVRKAGMARTADAITATGNAINPLNALAPVARTIPQGFEKIRDFFNPKNNTYLKAAEGQGEEIINALNTTKAATPGTQLTAADAAAGVDNAVYPALQAKAQGQAASTYDRIARGNTEARQSAIGQFAGTQPELEAAEAARSARAKVAYETAGAKPITGNPELETLLNSAAVDRVLSDVGFISSNREAVGKTPFTLERGAPATEGTPGRMSNTGQTNALGKPIRQFEAGTPASEATASTGTIGDLHTLQVALKDMMAADPAVGGLKGLSSGSIGDVRKKLIGWIEANSDKYAAARAQFKADSDSINKMRVGQELQSRLGDPLGATERAGTFARSVENAPALIKSSTGTQLYTKLEQVIGPENTAVVKGIQQDLAREALAESRAKAGTGAKIPDFAELDQGIRGVRGATLLQTLAEKLGNAINGDVLQAIAAEMSKPEIAAAAMRDALNYEKSRGTVRNALYARGRNINAATRGLNALVPQDQGRYAP